MVSNRTFRGGVYNIRWILDNCISFKFHCFHFHEINECIRISSLFFGDIGLGICFSDLRHLRYGFVWFITSTINTARLAVRNLCRAANVALVIVTNTLLKLDWGHNLADSRYEYLLIPDYLDHIHVFCELHPAFSKEYLLFSSLKIATMPECAQLFMVQLMFERLRQFSRGPGIMALLTIFNMFGHVWLVMV